MSAPVILCGKTEAIGAGVLAGLKPEYEVIHFIMTVEAGIVQIPAILRGEKSVPSDSALGSKNYSQPPICVILGAAFDDEGIEAMMEAAKTSGRPVPWLRPDTTKPAPPLGPEYGKAMVERVKELISRLEREGKMGEAALQWF